LGKHILREFSPQREEKESERKIGERGFESVQKLGLSLFLLLPHCKLKERGGRLIQRERWFLGSFKSEVYLEATRDDLQYWVEEVDNKRSLLLLWRGKNLIIPKRGLFPIVSHVLSYTIY